MEAPLPAQSRIAHFAQGGLEALAPQGVGDVVDRQAQEAQLVGIDPDPQGVAPLSQVLDIPDAGDAFELFDDVERREIGEIEAVMFGVRGTDRNDLHHIGRNLPGGDPGLFDRFREGRHRPGDTVLHIHGGGVQIVTGLEGDGNDRRAVGGGDRGAVQCPLHPAQLLLDGAGHRLFDDRGRRAGIAGGDLDRRGDDLGKLGYRKELEGDQPQQHDDDGDDFGDNRPIDKKERKHSQ